MKKHKKRPQGSKVQNRPPTFKKQLDATAANTGLAKLPTPALVATIDTMIGILRDRGVVIRDWDDKTMVVQKMKCIGSRVFILAPREKQGTEAKDGESGGRNQG